MRRRSLFFATISILSSLLLAPGSQAADIGAYKTHSFIEPIDAVSFGMPSDDIDLQVSVLEHGEWSDWRDMEIEKEFDPTLRESNLLTFGTSVTQIRVRGTTMDYDLHPLRVSTEPARYEVAALTPNRRPRILTREQWGANEDWLYGGNPTSRSDEIINETNASGNKTSRQIDCDNWQNDYPEDFRTVRTVTQDAKGVYRWPLRYSPQVKLIAVHHTAETTTDNERDPIERMRLIYQYHAQSRGWGDVGYHYIIDENGQIYEGRQGGDYVVAGHAFCSNVGTVGIALMGNFDKEEPTQIQMKSLQWLIRDLASKYNIDLNQEVTYHGELMQPVVGHYNLVATSCPGYYVRETLAQVRRNAASGRIEDIRFPTARGASRRNSNSTWQSYDKASVSPVGSLDIVGRPGSQQTVSLRVRALDGALNRRERIAEVTRSDRRIGIWQDIGTTEMRVRNEIILAERISVNSATTIRLRFQLPPEEGRYTVKIDDIPYILRAEGRRVSAAEQRIAQRVRTTVESTPVSTVDRNYRPGLTGLVPQRASTRVRNSTRIANSDPVRIRLGYEGATAEIVPGANATLNDRPIGVNVVSLEKSRGGCRATQDGIELGIGTIQITSQAGIHTIRSWDKAANRFRGTIECQIIDGALVLINELPLEEYMMGLAEQPDSEPYEKQRAFAIAARSYLAHYMLPQNRKFPGKPYDGDDSPARFQLYMGVYFEEHNPNWLRAAASTVGQVIKKDGQIVKTPYFSSDNGRTKSPEEAGWPNFPFAEVFSSKPDPWCSGMEERGHGVGMSGCGAEAQANEGKHAEEILMYYYPGTAIEQIK